MSMRYNDIDSETKTLVDNSNIWNLIYPVGSLYWTMTNISPEILFPVPSSVSWKWERVSGFVYAIADNEDKVAGQTGGSKTMQLNADNIPAHRHSMSHTHTRGTMEITGTVIVGEDVDSTYGANGAFYEIPGNGKWNPEGRASGDERGVAFRASRAWTGNTSEPTQQWTGTTGNAVAKPFEFMPPYTAAYCWRRVE